MTITKENKMQPLTKEQNILIWDVVRNAMHEASNYDVRFVENWLNENTIRIDKEQEELYREIEQRR